VDEVEEKIKSTPKRKRRYGCAGCFIDRWIYVLIFHDKNTCNKIASADRSNHDI